MGLAGTVPRMIVGTWQMAADERAELFRLIVETSVDMIVIVDRQFTPRYVSPSSHALVGYEPEELVGMANASFRHAEDRDRVTAAFEGLLLTRNDHDRIIYRLCHRDGRWIGSRLFAGESPRPPTRFYRRFPSLCAILPAGFRRRRECA